MAPRYGRLEQPKLSFAARQHVQVHHQETHIINKNCFSDQIISISFLSN
jgi:hypothetical protein